MGVQDCKSAVSESSVCMLEETILNVAINIICLGPSINGVYCVQDFTNKLYCQVYSDSPDFFSTLASTVICGSELLNV